MRFLGLREPYLIIILAAGCATNIGGGRPGRLLATAPMPASPADTIDQAGLLNAIAKLDAKLEAVITAQVGVGNSNVGGNVMLDSWVSIASVGGLVVLSLGLALIYRRTTQKTAGVVSMLIRQLETRRDRQPCNCGQCADCIVDSLRASCSKGHPLGKMLHKMVKRET